MAKATFDIKSIEIPAVAAKPLYAGVGAGDIAYTAVKEYVSDVQKKLTEVQKTVTTIDPKSLRKQAIDAAAARRSKVEATVADLQADAKALPTKVTSTVNENVALATATYADLAKRGETVVTRITGKAPTVQVKTTPKSATVSTKKAPAKKAPAKKAPVKKATAKKA